MAKDGVDLLGSPLGTDQYVEQFFDRKKQELHKLLKNLCTAVSVIGSQSAFLLLSKCVSFCRFVFHARTVHPGLFKGFAEEYDLLVLHCFSALVPGIDEDVLEQVRLPVRSGGLGLRRLTDYCIAAFHSSTSEAARYLKWKWELVNPLWKLEELMCSHNGNWSSGDPVNWEDINKQRLLSEVIDKYQVTEFQSRLVGSHVKQFNALQGEMSSGWLSATPSKENRLTNDEFETAVRMRLFVDVYNKEQTCTFCKDGSVVDMKGIHSISCSGGWDRTARHNIIRDILGYLCQQAGWAPQMEKKYLLRGCGDKPADIFLPSLRAGRGLAIDVTVSNPLRYSAAEGLSAAELAAEQKRQKYRERCAAEGIDFIAFSIESFGCLNEDGEKFLSDLCKRLAAKQGISLGVMMSEVRRKLSLALVRSVATSVLKRKCDSEELETSSVEEEVLTPINLKAKTSKIQSVEPEVASSEPKKRRIVKRRVWIKKAAPEDSANQIVTESTIQTEQTTQSKPRKR